MQTKRALGMGDRQVRLGRILSFCLLGVASSAAASTVWLQASNAQSLPAGSTLRSIPVGVRVTYVPTPAAVVTQMLELAEVASRDVVYDLSAKDGRLIIAAVQEFGAERGVGVEVDPALIMLSTENAKKAKVSDRIQFLQQDPFTTDLQEANVVLLSLAPETTLKLRSNLLSQLQPGTRIVSHQSKLGDWQPDKVVQVPTTTEPQTLFYWVVPAAVAGEWKGDLAISPNQNKPYTLQFSQTFQQVKGSVRIDGQEIPLQNIRLEGNLLRFTGNQTIQGQAMTIQFIGRVKDNTLRGVAELQGGIFSKRFPIAAKRTDKR
jgi:hypothetical protein